MPAQSPAPSTSPPTDPGWAWAPYEPDARRPWNLRQAAHLYRRAAFGANWSQLERALADGPQRSVDKLLEPGADFAAFNREYDAYEVAASGSGSADGLRAWWLRRMILTPHPLLEKMTLFWHSHLAASNATVQDGQLMRQHVGLLRSHALGRFQPLLEALCRDPAMLIWLDAGSNRKAAPNENFARALMEVFGLGAGHFSDGDVSEAARAFTGWFVFRSQLRYIDREHDSGVKEILGHEGNFRDEDVVRLVLGQPAAPGLLVRKLYRWLISETHQPAEPLVAPLANAFAQDYDVAKLTETMLRSNLFFSPAAYRQRVKCPVEFALGIVKGLEATVSTTQLGGDLAAVGQNLYHPPTVKGWKGGRHWINRATLVGRNNLALALVSGADPYGGKLDPGAVAKKHGHATPQEAQRFLLELFLQDDLPEAVRKTLLETVQTPEGSDGDPSRRLRRFTHAVITLPEFHLA